MAQTIDMRSLNFDMPSLRTLKILAIIVIGIIIFRLSVIFVPAGHVGVVYDRGAWEGTAVQVKDSMIAVDEDGGVFRFGAGIERISTPDIEQRIRQAMQYQAAQGF